MNCSRVLSMTNPALIDELKTLVEPGKVLTDADSLNTYGKDWTKHFAPAPSAIVFPKTIEQVQAVFFGHVLQMLGHHARLTNGGAVSEVHVENLVHIVE